MGISERYQEVRQKVLAACRQAGRAPEEVKLIAVTKYVDTERMREAFLSGARCMGENHAQEVREKLNFYKNNAIELHFIGQLQTNKIKYIIGTAEFVHSVDREHLLTALAAAAERAGIVQKILLQVNIGREPQKGGILPEALEALAEKALSMNSVSLRGLMCVPPENEPEKAVKYFAELYELREHLKAQFPEAALSELSMGMSRDYETAIGQGATMVRVGSAIFGPRGMK